MTDLTQAARGLEGNLDIYRDLALAVSLARRRMLMRFSDGLPVGGPRPVEWMALMWISELGGSVNQTLLSERLEMDTPSTARLVARLEVQGLVQRTPGVLDRRTKVVALTDHAQGLIEEGEGIGRRLREEMLRGVPMSDVQTCLRVLRTVAERLA